MGKWVGVEMSDHLSSFNPGKARKPKGHTAKRRKARKVSDASRHRNRSR